MFHELHRQVRNQLEVISGVAELGDDRAAVALSRSEVPHLVSAVRALLDAHLPDADGYCRTCWGRRWWFHSRPNVPCRQYLTARMALMDFDANPKHALDVA